jgi:hypothetical protein
VKWIMVLNDGTTYTDLDGCAIVAIPDWMPEEDYDEFVGGADGYYCFSHEPPEGQFKPNNGQTLDDVIFMDHVKNYEKCSGCGEMFNLNSGFERIMWAQHKCHESTSDWKEED